jgi:hypothetical protein
VDIAVSMCLHYSLTEIVKLLIFAYSSTLTDGSVWADLIEHTYSVMESIDSVNTSIHFL